MKKEQLQPLVLLLALWGTRPGWGAEKSQVELADAFFANTNVPVIRLEIAEPNLDKLRGFEWHRGASSDERPTVQATLREGGTVYTNVAVHLKGAAGSFQPIDRKPGLTLNFDKFAEGQRFHGMQKLSLNNSRQDQSYVTDKLCRELYEAAGVPVPRANYAIVLLNGRDLGLYVLTEGWHKDFLKRHFKNTRGNLYDGGFAQDITNPLQVNSGETPDDRSDLKALIAAAREPDLRQRLTRLEKVLDLDRFITLMVLDALLWNWDGYVLNRNNYRVYHDLDQDRMVFFPHGLDQMFWKPEGPLLPGAKGLVARAALEIPGVRTRYLDRASQLMTSLIRLEPLTNRVAELTAIVRPILTAKSPNGTRRYEQSLKTLSSRMAQRISSLEQQMADVKRLIKFDGTNTVALSGWMEAADRESPARPAETGGDKLLTIRAADGTAAKLWKTTVWLEGGRYRIEGRAKVQSVIPIAGASGASPRRKSLFETFFENVTAGTNQVGGGAGFLAFSHRKLTEGVDWEWFPFRESRDLQRRGELPPIEGSSQRLAGDSEWATLHYDFELRQPIADLDILCDLRASEGTAWFDPASLTIRKR